MPRIKYQDKRLSHTTLSTIAQANMIIEEYLTQGYALTLRQLYYQFVSRDLLPNNTKSYKNLGDAISSGRRAGLIDWDSITDRTRNLQAHSHWEGPQDIIATCARSYRIDMWENQDTRLEVWVEKDALAGVVERACSPRDIAFFACRGYTSDSEMWAAAQRLKEYEDAGQIVRIIHLGDHDPSGIDMTRDVQDRLYLFGADAEVKRVALNMDQVDQYAPPPNPAKVTDSRFQDYERKFGTESWELDALEPSVIVGIIEAEVNDVIDPASWDDRLKLQQEHINELRYVQTKWATIINRMPRWT